MAPGGQRPALPLRAPLDRDLVVTPELGDVVGQVGGQEGAVRPVRLGTDDSEQAGEGSPAQYARGWFTNCSALAKLLGCPGDHRRQDLVERPRAGGGGMQGRVGPSRD